MPPRTRCRRRCWRRCGCGPSTRRATRARGWRRSRPGGSSTPAAARPPATAARRRRTPSRRRAAPSPQEGDDTLFLLFCCCHPDLAPASQVALTLRAVGGLTTREIADAFYVPGGDDGAADQPRQAHRCRPARPRLDQPGDLAVVLRVLYLVYTAGHPAPARVDLAGEAIRLARQLTLATEEPEARGLLALMLLNHARLPARFDAEGRIVTLDRQDRGLWDTREIAEGVRVLQSALAATERPGPLPDRGRDRRPARRRGQRRGDRLAADPRLVRRPRRPHRRPGAPGPRRGARPRGRGRPRPRRRRRAARDRPAARGARRAPPLARRPRPPARARRRPPAAATAYAEAARRATNVAERDHLVRQAARARAAVGTSDERCRQPVEDA